jgi:alpha-tubulin suppressor-like RCC1 family protein
VEGQKIPSASSFFFRIPSSPLVSLSSHPDLLEPHILRSLSNVKAVSVHASCAGCHTIVLDVEGTAWLFGRNQLAALGVPGVDTISENAPRELRARDLGAPPGTVFVSAACGRSHSVLVGSNGRVWTAGLNSLGQV